MTADAAPTSDSDYAQHFIEQAMPFSTSPTAVRDG
jgi:hypothetical protein